MIKTFGGVEGSQSAKYDAKGSESMSAADSFTGGAASLDGGFVLGPSCGSCNGSAVIIEGSNSRVLSKVLGTFSASLFYMLRSDLW